MKNALNCISLFTNFRELLAFLHVIRHRFGLLFGLSNFANQVAKSSPGKSYRVRCERTVRRRSGMREREINMTRNAVSHDEYLIRWGEEIVL